MDALRELDVRLDAAKRKSEALGQAMEHAKDAYDRIRAQHEASLGEQRAIKAEIIALMSRK